MDELRESFLKSEIRCGHEVTTEVKSLWRIELDLLEIFIGICKKHNLRYMAFGGTLLGAVRHHGFIPWDDDIDICMFREDYDKFLKIAATELPDGIFLQTPVSDPEYLFGFTKLRNSNTAALENYLIKKHFCINQGIFIDIFPLDYLPQALQEQLTLKHTFQKLKQFYIDMHRRYRKIKYVSKPRGKLVNFLRRCRVLFYNLVNEPIFLFKKLYFELSGGAKHWSEKVDDLFSKNDKSTCELIGPCGWALLHNFKNFLYPKELFNRKTVELPFEYLTISVPEKSMDILEHTYGDWRTPVKGSQKHSLLEVSFDKSYKTLLIEKYGYSPKDFS